MIDVDEILSNPLLGSCPTCAEDIDRVRRVPVPDFSPDDLRQHLPECTRVLDDLLKSGHKVYVHCTARINRSPSTVIAYLHWYEGQDLDEAVEYVMRSRSCDPYVEAIRLAGEDRKD